MQINFESISYNQAKKDFGWEVSPLFEGTNLEQQWLDFWNLNLDPCRATEGAAGYDIFAPFNFSLKPNEEILVPTGLRLYIDNSLDVVLFVLPRSGAGFKCFIRLANTVGVIDKDYYYAKNEGHIFVKVRNESEDKEWTVKTGEAFAQGVLLPYYLTDRDAEQEKEVRTGGLGSTTKRAM